MAFYLQDFMENLEPLPEEMKNGLAAIEKLDSEVNDTMARTKKRVNKLFSKADSMNPNDLKIRFDAIMEDGETSVKKSENKVQIATDMGNLLQKYLSRLDNDLLAMKTELEANSSGITEIIEQNVLDSEQSDTTSQNNIPKQKENKRQLKKRLLENKKKGSKSNRNSKRKARAVPSHTVTSEDVTTISKNDTNILAASLMDLAIGPVETNSTAMEAAVSEAVIATQQQSTEGRRQVGLRTSLRAVKSNQPVTGQKHSALEQLPKEVLINEELARVYEILNPNGDKEAKNTDIEKIQTAGAGISTEEDMDINEAVGSNEIVYCICQNVAYGSMVACDNIECPSEWFHYGCVGIKAPPKGKWFCPQCITKMKNRKSHK